MSATRCPPQQPLPTSKLSRNPSLLADEKRTCVQGGGGLAHGALASLPLPARPARLSSIQARNGSCRIRAALHFTLLVPPTMSNSPLALRWLGRPFKCFRLPPYMQTSFFSAIPPSAGRIPNCSMALDSTVQRMYISSVPGRPSTINTTPCTVCPDALPV